MGSYLKNPLSEDNNPLRFAIGQINKSVNRFEPPSMDIVSRAITT